jgi:methyl-accepting chemotaxis protein
MDNRRKTIVINKKFQYQYSLLIVALTVLLVNGFIVIRMLFPGEHPVPLTTSMTAGLAAVEFILVGSIWYGSLKASHRIAGPVYVFAREIDKLGTGDLTAHITLRDKDMFQPEAVQMNSSIAALRAKMDTVKRLSKQLQQVQSADDEISAIVEQLSNELSTFTTANGE